MSMLVIIVSTSIIVYKAYGKSPDTMNRNSFEYQLQKTSWLIFSYNAAILVIMIIVKVIFETVLGWEW